MASQEMYRQNRNETSTLSSPAMSRSQSAASDRVPLPASRSLMSPPGPASPEPAYVAASAASQIVTSDHDANAYTFTEDGFPPTGETAIVAPASLRLVNGFLDQLLYNFLSVARSTSLAALRPAVLEVLKPTLAREAIAGADEELQQFLGGSEDEELEALHNGQGSANEWDLELVWRRTRLRCMVYSSLGDVEEEDEDRYAEQEQFHTADGTQERFMSNAGVISPPVAIFLTSILEFIGEQSLLVAGQAAYIRLHSRKRDNDLRRPSHSPSELFDRVVVEELDMEKIALNATLGRLWRTWRKRIRSSSVSSRPISRDSTIRRQYQPGMGMASRRNSSDTMDSRTVGHTRSLSLPEVLEEDVAANIALPISANDIEEIEVPGLAHINQAESQRARKKAEAYEKRPQSLIIFPHAHPSLTTPEPSPTTTQEEDEQVTPQPIVTRRARSRSLPVFQAALFFDTSEDSVDPSIVDEASEGETPTGAAQTVMVAGQVKGSETQEGRPGTSESLDQDVEDHEILEGRRISVDVVRHTPVPATFLKRSGTSETIKSLGRPMSGARTIVMLDTSQPSSPHPSTENDQATIGEESINEEEDQSAIGVARTSNKSVPAVAYTSPNPSSGHVSRVGSRSGELEKRDHDRPEQPAVADRGYSDGAEDAHSADSDFALENPPHPRALRINPSMAAPKAIPRTNENAALEEDEDFEPADQTVMNKSGSNAGSPTLVNGHSRRSGSVTSAYSHARQASIGSKTSERWNGQDRAAVQRVYAPASSPREAAASRVRKSEDSTRAQRAIYTSDSSSAPYKILEKQVSNTRSSEEDRSSIISARHSLKVAKPKDKERNFEQLMQSEETIQYTLTPQNMREMEAPESPRWGAPRSELAELADFIKSTGPEMIEPQRPTTQRSVIGVKPFTALRSNSHSHPRPMSPKLTKPNPSQAKGSGLIPISPTSPVREGSRSSGALARDPRIEKASTRDFADFIRSTGPDRELVKPATNGLSRGSSVTGSLRSRSTTAIPSSGSMGPKAATGLRSHAPQTTGPSTSPVSAKSKARLQARDAAAPSKYGSSDLINFIREGPPEDPVDKISSMAPSRAAKVSSPAPTSSTADGTRSVGSSLNSQSALLKNGRGSGNRGAFDEPAQPKRTQRRVKDPYAIDSDSDLEDEMETTPKGRGGLDESLLDFLRNVPPPETSTVKPVYNNATKAKPSAPSSTKKAVASSFSSKASRLTGAAPQISLGGNSGPSLGSGSLGLSGNGAVRSPAGSATPSRAELVAAARKANMAPRAASSRRDPSSTSDLAEFLKSSAPPPSPPPVQHAAPVKDEPRGFAKMFRKKRSALV